MAEHGFTADAALVLVGWLGLSLAFLAGFVLAWIWRPAGECPGCKAVREAKAFAVPSPGYVQMEITPPIICEHRQVSRFYTGVNTIGGWRCDHCLQPVDDPHFRA